MEIKENKKEKKYSISRLKIKLFLNQIKLYLFSESFIYDFQFFCFIFFLILLFIGIWGKYNGFLGLLKICLPISLGLMLVKLIFPLVITGVAALTGKDRPIYISPKFVIPTNFESILISIGDFIKMIFNIFLLIIEIFKYCILRLFNI